MKTRFSIVFATALLAGSAGFAQMPGAGTEGMPGPASSMRVLSKLFGSNTAFSAKSEVRVLDQDQTETMSSAMDFAFLDGKVRVQIDTAQVKSKDLPPTAAAGFKQMGMDQVVSIVRPDKKTMVIVYPKLESFTTMPLPKEEAEAAEPTKIEREAIDKEILDGHPCVKNKVTVTDAGGQQQELTVWNAADLKGFPVQILARQGDSTSITRYKQIQLVKPDAKLFDPPAGFKEYTDMQAFIAATMAKMTTNSAPK